MKINFITNYFKNFIMKSNIFTKSNVEFHEYNMHLYVENTIQINIPKIINYNPITKTMQMEKIHGMSVADFYGESFDSVPNWVIGQIRQIVSTLKSANIIYPDITGYNFIIGPNDKIYIIDFEHARFWFSSDNSNEFVDQFIGGAKSWNPDFV